MHQSGINKALAALLLLATLACTPATQTPTATLEASQTTIPSATASPTATPIPPRQLTICSAEKPASLYIFDGSQTISKANMLQAIYDGPIDVQNGQPTPVIVEKIPSSEDASLRLEAVAVTAGMEVVDANGNRLLAKAGMKVRPSGCTATACAVSWDGASALQMDQLVAEFHLKPGLLWADGSALTAADSVFTYQVAADINTPMLDPTPLFTAAYAAVDDLTLRWTGKPGYTTANLAALFFHPLPQHQLSQYTPQQLLTATETTQAPLGWGAYTITQWQENEITLQKNPNYFRAAEGLPKYDLLTFRFIGNDPQNALQALQNGECDLVDRSIAWNNELETLSAQAQAAGATLFTRQADEWEGLFFGIQPAAYDNGYNYLYENDRMDFLGDAGVRQAIAHCINRQTLQDGLFGGLATEPAWFVPADDALRDDTLAAFAFDPALGQQLLDASGWLDVDADPATPRVAWTVVNVPMATPLVLNYHTSPHTARQLAATQITENLAACGIGINLITLPENELFAPGDAGVLFGRNFDLAQFAWQSSSQPACTLFQSLNMPSAANNWVGANLGGLKNAALDAACSDALLPPLDAAAFQAAYATVQQTLWDQLPAVPLYHPLQIRAVRACFAVDVLQSNNQVDFLNLEHFDFSENCP